MKILYISHFKEESGYGRFCREFLKCLKTTDAEVSSLAIKLGKAKDYMDETEKVSLYNPDVVIQNILPHMMSKGNFKCVGTAILENKDVHFNYWESYLNLLDEVWYPHYPLHLFKKEREILTGIDIDKYTKQYPGLKINHLNGTYKFYWIGEISARKNLSGLIKAYYTAFSHSDPVSLIIKCHNENFDQEQVKDNIEKLVYTIAKGMKLYNNPNDYPRIQIIPYFLKEEEIYGLHQYGDCFVSSSYGESINYPMIDAMGFNKPIVATRTFATSSYTSYGNINLAYNNNKDMCYGQTTTFPWYQTSREEWFAFDIKDFASRMRTVFENRPYINNDVSGLSYKNIGQKIMESL